MTQRTLFRRQAGFTLVEMLVVVTVIGILSAIAYPAYTQHVERARRAAARAVLMEAAQYLERYYAGANTYEGVALPDRLAVAPAGVPPAEAAYAISAINAASSGYTLKATPTRSDACGDLTLDETGARGRSGTELSVETCWR